VPSVLVYEKPFLGTAQGQYIGAWRAGWNATGGVRTRFVGVYPSQWRSRVLGKFYGGAKRDIARAHEQRVALTIAHRAVGADEAPAICIAKWASHAGEVLAKLPESKRKVAS
jgi:hypothetical protein